MAKSKSMLPNPLPQDHPTTPRGSARLLSPAEIERWHARLAEREADVRRRAAGIESFRRALDVRFGGDLDRPLRAQLEVAHG